MLVWITIYTFAFTHLAAAVSSIDILYLGPTCGRDYGKYQSGVTGLNLALQDLYLTYSNESFVNMNGQLISLVRLSPNEIAVDGGCELIRNRLLSNRKFVLLGGGCSCTTKYAIAPSFLPDIVPQITFDTIYTDQLELTHTLMMVPVAPIGLKELVFHLVNDVNNSRHKSREFGLIYDISMARSMELRSTARQIITSMGGQIDVEISSNSSDLLNDMNDSRLRNFFVLLPLTKLKDLLCSEELRNPSQAGRYLLAIPISMDDFSILTNYSSSLNDRNCQWLLKNMGPALRFALYDENVALNDFLEQHRTVIGGLDQNVIANVYQSTLILIQQLNISKNVANLTSEILEKSPWFTAAGKVTFNDRQRFISIKILTYGGSPPSTDRLILVEDLENIAVWVFILTSLLTVVCLVLTITIMIWNICHSSDRMVKMTSPQMNIIICIGSILACLCVPVDGLSTFMISAHITAVIKSLIFCVLPMAFTLVFGSTALKLWRIFAIFSNINVKRRNTKDWCLVALLTVPTCLDLALTVAVVIFDSIRCEVRPVSQFYQQSEDILRQRNVMVCGNRFWCIWVLMIYIFKIPLGLVAIYFAWRIRHITLTSLREGNRVFLIICSAWGLSLLSLPVFLNSAYGNMNPSVQHAIFSITILLPLITFHKLHFLSKISRLREIQKKAALSDKYKFSESFRATHDSLTAAEEDRMENFVGRCFNWFTAPCGRRTSDQNDDSSITSNNLLLNEISNLKRSLQEKDTIIRDLTDRLFYGYDNYKQHEGGEASIGLSQSSTSRFNYIPNDSLAHHTSTNNSNGKFSAGVPFRPARPLRSYSLATFNHRCEYLQESDSALETSPSTSEQICTHCDGSNTATPSTTSMLCFKESPFSPRHVNLHI